LEKYYITTAINYTNGKPHIGHAYESITADVIARWHRIFGREVFFLTGSDEHGQKIADTAAKIGVTPLELCNENVELFKALNTRLNISNDRYIRTTDPRHTEVAQLVFSKAVDAGDIYLKRYEGWYNPREERYVKDSDAKLTDYKDPETGRPYTKHSEPAYFFRMSRYWEWLRDYLEANPDFIHPRKTRNHILSRLAEPLEELCVSRSSFDWGVPLPGIPGHVMYVWFDALTNYLTGIGWPEEETARYWPPDCQIIGNDIAWFHTVIWPSILRSCSIPLPKQIVSHGLVLDSEGRKMSKSLGNVVEPNLVLDRYGSDALRFYLLHSCNFGEDFRFNEAALARDHDTILGDSFGNCFRRCQMLTLKMCSGRVPDCAPEVERLAEHGFSLAQVASEIDHSFRKFDLKGALELTVKACQSIDHYLQSRKPWNLGEGEERDRVIRSALEAAYACAHLLEPVTPSACKVALSQFDKGQSNISSLTGNLTNLEPGSSIRSPAVVLFKKLDLGKKLKSS